MMLPNLRVHAAFLTILLVFCYFIGLAATADTNSLPESVVELISGKTTDFTGVANQIPERQLPTALAAAKLLKFRALHGETSLSSNEAEAFETILLDRMSTARQVAFSQNETCRKKVEQHEIMFDGQKLLVPTHFVADTALAIIDRRPKGEAGSLFPDFSIEVFSQSLLTEITLAINGQTVNTKNILIKQSENAFELSYRTPAMPESLLSIGTHTAEITIRNQSGETTKQEWLFTVGVHDTSTLPLTADAVIISELDLPLEKILPGAKAFGQLTVVVYQNAAGTRFTEYRFTTATGQTITSQNLAFIARKITAGRDDIDKLSFSPQTHYAFAGNLLNFSYTYSGSGDVISEKWLVSSGGHSTTEPVITMNGGAVAECTITVEKKSTNSAGEEVVYQYDVVGIKYVSQVKFRKLDIYSPDPHLQHVASCSFAIENTVISNVSDVALVEGEQYTVSFDKTEGSSNAGVLTVDKLSWHIHASEGSPKIENPSATSTRLISNTPGYAELVLNIELIWQEAGETYTSALKPSVSALFANYPITAKAEFSKYPPGIICLTSRHIELKSFEFSIKDQKRLIANPGDCELANPILICQSSIWPASAPIMINKVLPMLSHGSKKEWLEEVSPFTFQTPEAEENVNELPLCLGGHFQAAGYFTDKVIISDLPSVPIFSWDDDLLSLNLVPAGPVTTYEGAVTTFSAVVEPSPEMGSGILSATANTLDLLDGYKVAAVGGIAWFEAPLDFDGDWKNKAASGQDYSHVFNPDFGPGSYTMNCTAVMKMQESDTADSFIISAENKAPVDFLPGLRIFSPINELAYPVNVSLKVKTSFDKETEIWEKIKWRLNGKEYHHGLDEAPFFIDLNRTGKWSLQAELTIKNPVTDEDMLLKDQVDFIVNPVEINLTPARKVFDLSTQKSQEFSLNITLNGKKVENPGKPVEWSDDGLKAIVDPIEWFSATAPNGCAAVNHDEDNPTARVDFVDAGAATILATVTVRLIDGEEYFRRRHKGFEDEFEEPIFTFPAVRADVWAVLKPSNVEITEGFFPEKGLGNAHRTFELKKMTFYLGQDKYVWSVGAGIQPAINLNPAVPFSLSTIGPSAQIRLSWQGPTNQEGLEPLFQPLLPIGAYSIQLDGFLTFDRDEIPLVSKEVTGKAEDFLKMVKVSVDPATFSIWIGQERELTFKLESLTETLPPGEPPPEDLSTRITVQDGNFTAEIESVLWDKDGQTIGTGNPFAYLAKNKSIEPITAYGKIRVQENKVAPIAEYSSYDAMAKTLPDLGRLIAEPGKGDVLPASYPILLLTANGVPDPETVIWYFHGQEVGKGPKVVVPAELVAPGSHVIKAEHPGLKCVEVRTVKIFPWEVRILPPRQVYLWEGQPIPVNVSVEATTNGKSVVSGSVLKVDEATVTVSSLKIEHAADPPETVDFPGLSAPGSKQCIFKKPGAFGLKAGIIFSVKQKTREEGIYAPDPTTSLLGALEAKAEYSFAFEPKHAIVGCQRVFSVGSVTVKIQDHPDTVIDQQIPQPIEPAMEIVKPLFENQKGIFWVEFSHKKSVTPPRQEVPGGIDWQPVFFENMETKKVEWKPLLKLDDDSYFSLSKTEREITPKKLSDCISTEIFPGKTKLLLGEPTDLSLKFGEAGSSPESQSDIFLFNKEFKVTLEPNSVDWFANGQELSGKTPNISFSRTTISDFQISATPTFVIEPVEGEIFGAKQKLDVNGPELNVSGNLKLFANGVALDEAKLYQGQRVILEPKMLGFQAHEFPLPKYSWKIEDPALYGLHVSLTQGNGEVVPATVEDGRPVELLLYSYDSAKRSKTVVLSFPPETGFDPVGFQVPFSGPTWLAYHHSQAEPNLWDAYDAEGRFWKVGYQGSFDGPFVGHQGFLSAKNETEVTFTFLCAQFMRSFTTRELSGGMLQSVDIPEFWLDNGYPYKDPNFPLKVTLSPGKSVLKINLDQDIPNEPVCGPTGHIVDAVKYNAKNSFITFILVKPEIEGGDLVPVFVYEWGWGINAFRKADGTWEKVLASLSPKTPIMEDQVSGIPLDHIQTVYPQFQFGFPSWKNKLIFGSGEDYPWESK